jgi:large subunit ribosomal protein L21
MGAIQERAMYAVFEDGSRQYRVSEGDLLRLDYRGAEVGSRIEFTRVLLYQAGDDTRIGQPLIEGARILAEVVDHPTTKLYIQHFRKRKNYRRFRGHRQPFTEVQVRSILQPGMEPPPEPPPPQAPLTPSGASETPSQPAPGAPAESAAPPAGSA